MSSGAGRDEAAVLEFGRSRIMSTAISIDATEGRGMLSKASNVREET